MRHLSPRCIPALLALSASLALGACNDDRADRDNNVTLDVGVLDADGDATDGGGNPTLDAGVPNCPGEDRFSPNHGPADAADLNGQALIAAPLLVCAGFDDWFRIDASAGRTIRVTAAFEHADGDLDLYLFADDGGLVPDAPVATSATDQDIEEFVYTAPFDGSWVLKVEGFEGATNAYELSISTGCASDDECPEGTYCSLVEQGCVEVLEPLCGEDAFEPNDTLTDARVLRVEDGRARVTGGQVCEEDDDIFVIELTEPATVEMYLSFDDGEDLDLLMYDANGLPVARTGGEGATPANPERLLLTSLPAGRWYVVVDQFVTGLGLDAGYSLEVNVTVDSCTSNRDCTGAGARQVCEDGGCVPFVVSTPGDAGAPCDDSGDCVEGLGCYQGAAGFDDNFCSQTCNSDAECGFFDNGYCVDLFQTAVCFDACVTDDDCPQYYACGAQTPGRCDILLCATDDDCTGDRVCRRTEQQNTGVCTAAEYFACDEDDVWEPNDTESAATVLTGDDPSVRGATICDGNDDWYAVTLPEHGTRLQVEVSFDTATDLDVFIFDQNGAVVGEGSLPDANPEVASARYLAAGTYLIRVNQFPTDRDTTTFYTLVTSTSRDTCSLDGGECLSLDPIRAICDATADAPGACLNIDGNGEIPYGDPCDSQEDCVVDGEAFCWTRESASTGRNVCTHRCGDDSECGDVPDTTCEIFGGRFGVCLP